MKKKLEEDKRKFKLEKKLFKIQWKLLEGEFVKLAAEKERLEKEKEFFKRVQSFEKAAERENTVMPAPKMFFAGVKSEESLRKRYKELMKIYHPDNPSGDNDIVLMINKEYLKLKESYIKK